MLTSRRVLLCVLGLGLVGGLAHCGKADSTPVAAASEAAEEVTSDPAQDPTEKPAYLPATMLPDRLRWVSPLEHEAFVQSGGMLIQGWITLPPALEDDVPLPASTQEREYVGPEVCGNCHPEKLEGFLETAHARTSRQPGSEVFAGKMGKRKTLVQTKHPELHFKVERRKDGVYQAAYLEHEGQRYRHAERMDLVTGSGHNGQTFLYWKGDALYQLPTTFFVHLNSWVNRPGYPDGSADFARPVPARCLDCHATWFRQIPSVGNRFEPEDYILGVTCERCHGPGRQHVDFHTQDTSAEARFIVHPGRLDRDRTNDICAQCHSGEGSLKKPAFSFRPGDDLDDYLDLSKTKVTKPGIHTNTQLLRLQRSLCFQRSEAMTCATCHDPHRNEHGDMAAHSQRCLKCHEVEQCLKEPVLGAGIVEHCGACHMPRTDTADTMFHTAESTIIHAIRDHRIQRATDPAIEALLSR